MKRKAEEKSPSTPDTQKGWLKNRCVSNRVPCSSPDDPPSPSPKPRNSRNRTSGLDSSWVQLGGIAQAGQSSSPGQTHISNGSDHLWISSFNDGNEAQLFDEPMADVTSAGDISTSDGFFPLNVLPEYSPPRHDNKTNVPFKNFTEQKHIGIITKANGNEENEGRSENYENPITQSSQETNPTIDIHKPDVAQHAIHSPSLNIVMLPSTDLTRPLAPGDEVHLLDSNNNDLSGQITYKITSNPTPEGIYTITPVPTTLRCPATQLLRAPLMDGDIVSVFQPVVHVVNGVQRVKSEQADWGAVTKRWVVDGEKRFNVVSWDERSVGRLWEGLRDGELGQYDIGELNVGGKDV